MPLLHEILRADVDAAREVLVTIDERASRVSRAPGRWSPRQVIGHLVDSAHHNHGRVVDACLRDTFVFAGYQQDQWVEIQRYNEIPFPVLLDLWAGMNRRLAHTLADLPAIQWRRERRPHNLYEIAWRPPAPEQPATLDYLVRDYIHHLRHHVNSLLPSFFDPLLIVDQDGTP